MSISSFASFYDLFFKKTGYIPVFINGLEHIAIFEGKRHNIFGNIIFYRFFVNFKDNKITLILLNEDENLKLYRGYGKHLSDSSFEEGINYYIKFESSIAHYD
jgi:hypothetical protein